MTRRYARGYLSSRKPIPGVGVGVSIPLNSGRRVDLYADAPPTSAGNAPYAPQMIGKLVLAFLLWAPPFTLMLWAFFTVHLALCGIMFLLAVPGQAWLVRRWRWYRMADAMDMKRKALERGA